MLPPKQNLSADRRQLIKLYDALSTQGRENLLAFAEFLVSRDLTPDETVIHEPKELPRPDEESVVGAIKRLSESYFMLDKSALFTETSTLMTSHIMHGRAAPDVIDELEELFVSHYERYVSDNQ